jgi:phosphopantothenoylcysteine decarboxylase/phosphopantothenate--cysteine ligase
MVFGRHTSKEIIGTRGDYLKAKVIVLCVTGSVAAIKSPEIARELMRQGAEVYSVMTPMAQKIIHPYMMEWATGNQVVTELTGQVEHVTFGGDYPNNADLVLVAPSTANTIGKTAAAIDDTPVTTLLTTAIGASIPIIIAPAMHASMYRHPIVMENVEKLCSLGVEVLMPRIEEEKAKIPGTMDIVEAVIMKLAEPKDFKDKKILITAGPTWEYLDGFRYISPPSSGKMGIAIAREALRRGAEVSLVYGPGTEKPPTGVRIVHVETTEEMLTAVVEMLKNCSYNVAILSAAVADYGVKDRKMVKTPAGKESWTIDLIPKTKIIDQVKEVDPSIFLVGFKAEYSVSDEELIGKASKRMEPGKIDLIVANDVARDKVGFGHDTNEVFIIDNEGQVEHISLTSKAEIAKRLLNNVIEKI